MVCRPFGLVPKIIISVSIHHTLLEKLVLERGHGLLLCVFSNSVDKTLLSHAASHRLENLPPEGKIPAEVIEIQLKPILRSGCSCKYGEEVL